MHGKMCELVLTALCVIDNHVECTIGMGVKQKEQAEQTEHVESRRHIATMQT